MAVMGVTGAMTEIDGRVVGDGRNGKSIAAADTRFHPPSSLR